jgi:hypothetical protein
MNTNDALADNQDNQEIDLFLLFSKIGIFFFRWIGFFNFGHALVVKTQCFYLS